MPGPLFAFLPTLALAGPLRHTEVAVDLAARSPSDLRGPHVGFAEGGHGTVRHLLVDDVGLVILQQQGLTWSRLPPPPDNVADGYHSPEDLLDALDEVAFEHPHTTRRFDLGTSVEGRPIAGLRITLSDEPRGHVRILAAHHGDELISTEVALALARSLADPSPAVETLLEDVAVWVVPQVNPDGVAEHTRHNARDVDLNRNYPYRWSPDEFHPGATALSEPETRAVEALALRAPPSIGLSLHSGATNFGWVWNYTTEPSEDADEHRAIAETYADSCTADGFWITNGADWYPTNGDTNDWAYGYWGTFDYTVELSPSKTPPADQIEAWTDAHLSALLDTLLDTPVAHARVIDAETGLPVRSTIRRAPEGQPVRTTDDGRFGLALPTPDTVVYVSAPGYETRQVELEHTELIELNATREVSARTIWPPVVSLEAVETVWLDATAEVAALHPPGRPAQSAPLRGRALQVDTIGKPPGAWQVVVDGEVLPDMLLVDAPDAAPILARQLDGTALVVDLAVGSAGREAWVYLDGQLAAQEWIAHSDPRVLVDLSGFPTDARVDVALHGPGGMVWVADAFQGAWTASATPPGTDGLDTGLQSVPSGRAVGCGCTSAPVSPPWFLGVVWMGWIRRRDP